MRQVRLAGSEFDKGRFSTGDAVRVWLVLFGLCSMPMRASASNLTVEPCASLRNLEIPATQIGIPSGGARVRSASTHTTAHIAYCAVRGDILPIKHEAAPIRFAINLPTPWNGKAVQFGGAVFDGFLHYSDGLGQPTIGLKHSPTPLQQTYATFGSDSGHRSKHFLLPGFIGLFNATFADDVEQQNNFIRDSLKKTHDVAKVVMLRFYGTGPTKMFFLGSSSGGHEALEVVQNWPDDYDGVMSGYPSWDGTELALQFLRTSQALYASGGFLPRSATKLLAHSVLQSCDSLDGAVDGLVSNVAACRFDPETLLCTIHPQKGCLSAKQLATVRTFATEQRTNFPLANGVDSMPGYNILSGAELSPIMLGIFHHAQRHPKLLFNSVTYLIADRAMQHFVGGGKDVASLTVDPATGGVFQAKLQEVSKSYDASSSDLSHFAAHGGKLLLLHGTADVLIPTDSSVMYYRRVQAAMGPSAVNAFMRLYLIPGFGHGTGPFYAGMDALGVLDSWVANGSVPPNIRVEDKNKHAHGRTRPLCAYPTWPRYNGVGSLSDAKSFTCATEER